MRKDITMNQLIVAALAATAILGASAQSAVSVVTNADGKVVRKVDRARLDAIMESKTGGKIIVPNSMKGRIVYVNAQTRAPRKWLEQNADTFGEATKLAIEVADGRFDFPSPKIQGEASLFVIDDPSLPPLLSAPESRWCMVNVAPLAKGAGEKPQFFAARVQKELTRGFCLLAGAQNSGYPDALVGCITKPEDLDKFADCRLPIDVMNRFAPYLKGYGITPKVYVTYKKACQEGWAPPPTNDVQRAIWNETRQLPTNPIKIEFDPEKGK